MTDYRNGAKDRVLSLIKQGVSDRDAIMAATGLTLLQVNNALKRLQADGDVMRKHQGGYAPSMGQCLLEAVWR